ncbi:hypothetical protein GJAV_G00271550 [Gymnothorax javanicus]|nr:hypothetical protein GJAV_G00271550 [Gymnothorax javanicus]
MTTQSGDSMQAVHLQAGPESSADIDLSVAQMIGWQLAVIGDELNRHHLNKPANPGLQCLLRATQALYRTRGRIHRQLLAHWQMHRRRPGKMWAWLTSVRHRKLSRAECRGSWDTLRSAFPYSWAAGLLTAVLLTTAVAWISY